MMTLTTNNTMKEIANRYNELADVKVDIVKLSKLGKAKVLAKLEILEQEFAKKQTKTKAKAKQRKPKSVVGAFIKEMLLVVKEDGFGYSHKAIVEMVKENFPENAPTMNYLRIIQYRMNVEGVELPKRPRVK